MNKIFSIFIATFAFVCVACGAEFDSDLFGPGHDAGGGGSSAEGGSAANGGSTSDGGAGDGGAGGDACADQEEVCDGIDNNCDDQIDEDRACSSEAEFSFGSGQAKILVRDSGGNTVTSQTTQDPISGDHVARVEGEDVIYLRTELPIFELVSQLGITEIAAQCDNGGVDIPVSQMEEELDMGGFATFEVEEGTACGSGENAVCHKLGCEPAGIHTFRIILDPAL